MQYLRQLKTGHIYPWTEILAKRRDMVPFDAAQAKVRIDAMKNMLSRKVPTADALSVQAEAARKAKASSMELTELENKVDAENVAAEKAIEDAALPDGKKLSEQTEMTGAETIEAQRQSVLDQDPKYQNVMGFKSRNQVEQYMILEFGQEIDVSLPFKDLKQYAINKTSDRILEGY